MVAPNTGSEETIRYDIAVEAKLALTTLQKLYEGFETSEKKVKDFANVLLLSSKEWNLSLENTVRVFKQINSEMEKQGKSVFGVPIGGGNAMIGEAGQLAESLKKVGVVSDEVSPKLNQVTEETKKIPPATKNAGNALSEFGSRVKAILTSHLILAAFKALMDFFNGAMKAAQDFRGQLAQLNLAEAILSKKGMDITRKELDSFISDIETKYQYLSKLQATTIVGETAGAVSEFDVSKKQLGELADAIAFIQLKNQMLGREEADAAHIINAAMDARSNFFNGMGINITEAMIAEKAYRMGLAETGKELDKATRFQAVMALLTEQTANKQGELNKQLEGTPLGNQMKASKDWKDAMLQVGNAFLSVKDNILELWNNINANGDVSTAFVNFFVDLAYQVNSAIDAIDSAVGALQLLGETFDLVDGKFSNVSESTGIMSKAVTDLVDALNPLENILALLQGIGALIATSLAGALTFIIEILSGKGFTTSVYDAGIASGEAFITGMSTALATGLQNENGWLATTIKKWWMDNFKIDLNTFNAPDKPAPAPTLPDTPTGESQSPYVVPDKTKQEDIKGALEKMNEEILQAQIKLGQDMEEAAIDWNRKLEDITIEYARKRAEAEKEYANKVRDINNAYSDRIASINAAQAEHNQQHRNDELQRELEFQNKMQEMKEKFLMDLDDALHSRDARQILKLIKQYNLEKLQAERAHALDVANAARDEALQQQSYARQRAEAEKERKRKLAEAAQDYQDKLDKLAADEAAERAAADLAYERKKQDLEREMKNRLEIVAANLVSEFNLTQTGLNAIVQLYQKYYAEVSGIYAAMQAMMAGSGTLVGMVQDNRNNSKPTSTTTGWNGTKSPDKGERDGKMASSSKSVSMASFSPVPKFQGDVNSASMGSSSSSGGGGISIEVLLSPDLESRIISNTLSKTAQVITKVSRSK